MHNSSSIDEYISGFDVEERKILQKVRTTIKNVAPNAVENISYGIPTFKLKKNLAHFAGYKTHIGFYPGAQAISYFSKDLAKYKTSKGTIQFDIKQPIDYELIKKITKYCVTKAS